MSTQNQNPTPKEKEKQKQLRIKQIRQQIKYAEEHDRQMWSYWLYNDVKALLSELDAQAEKMTQLEDGLIALASTYEMNREVFSNGEGWARFVRIQGLYHTMSISELASFPVPAQVNWTPILEGIRARYSSVLSGTAQEKETGETL